MECKQSRSKEQQVLPDGLKKTREPWLAAGPCVHPQEILTEKLYHYSLAQSWNKDSAELDDFFLNSHNKRMQIILYQYQNQTLKVFTSWRIETWQSRLMWNSLSQLWSPEEILYPARVCVECWWTTLKIMGIMRVPVQSRVEKTYTSRTATFS